MSRIGEGGDRISNGDDSREDALDLLARAGVYEPVDQPYGYREYSARDSEGGVWSFMKPLD